ncbi:MAG: hypothetical protein KDA24_12580, partial [Deltaproteobacteria bacterium]|nr:hypothetical protein [Deltaproteobacteria bacterium]
RWLSEADQAAKAGSFDDAVRLVWLGVLASQDLAGAVHASPGRTNGEHRRSWHGSATDLVTFVRVADRVDRLRYGGVRADQASWSSLRAECSPLLQEARS